MGAVWRISGTEKDKAGLESVAHDIGAASVRSVLHVGCGPEGPHRLHRAFDGPGWSETRLDIDQGVKPAIVSSITDMAAVADAAHDAVWASHTIEHLGTHEVPLALAEFRRVLNPHGFALLRTPDLAAVAEAVLAHGPDHVAYVSPAGPITPLDMLFGHSRSIRRGNAFMAHRTAFTADRLGRLLLAAGFAEVRTCPLPEFDLWALALMPDCDRAATLQALAEAGLDMRDDG
jgi:predicted SAM-dependent methyltransferase